MLVTDNRVLNIAFSETKTFLNLEEDSGCLEFSILGRLKDMTGGLDIMKEFIENNSINQYQSTEKLKK